MLSPAHRLCSEMSDEDFAILNSALTPVVISDAEQASLYRVGVAVYSSVGCAGLGGVGGCCCDSLVANHNGQVQQRPATNVFLSKP